jgi:hypothetical protein
MFTHHPFVEVHERLHGVRQGKDFGRADSSQLKDTTKSSGEMLVQLKSKKETPNKEASFSFTLQSRTLQIQTID